MPGEQKPKVKKLSKVVIIHCGHALAEAVKPLARAVEEELKLERVGYYRNKASIDKLNNEIESVKEDTVRGICVITPQLLQLLSNGPKDAVQQFEDCLQKEMFVCLKFNVTDEGVKKILPNICVNLSLEIENVDGLCHQMYKQWFGSNTGVDATGYHCVIEDDHEQINTVHIIHAGEEKGFLNDLSDALEDVANPESSCEYRRFYREGHKIAENIVTDLNEFVESCRKNNQNKCMLVVSDCLIDVLTKSPQHIENIKKPIYRDYTTKVPNFVLLVMTNNDIFQDTSFWPITVEFDRRDMVVIAKEALSIWLKPHRSPEESFYNSGEKLNEAKQQIQSNCTSGDAGKVVPSAYNSVCNPVIRTPRDGQLVCDPKSILESTESMEHVCSDVHSKETKCLPNNQAKDVYRPEIKRLDKEQKSHMPREHIPSDNPEDLMSNPPKNYQPANPDAVKGKVALNGLQHSLSMNAAYGRGQNISYKTDVRNSNHNNENASQASSKDLSKSNIQSTPAGTHTILQSSPAGTRTSLQSSPAGTRTSLQSSPVGTHTSIQSFPAGAQGPAITSTDRHTMSLDSQVPHVTTTPQPAANYQIPAARNVGVGIAAAVKPAPAKFTGSLVSHGQHTLAPSPHITCVEIPGQREADVNIPVSHSGSLVPPTSAEIPLTDQDRMNTVSSRDDDRMNSVSSRDDDRMNRILSRDEDRMNSVSSRDDDRMNRILSRDEDRMNSVSSQDVTTNSFASLQHKSEIFIPESGPKSAPAEMKPGEAADRQGNRGNIASFTPDGKPGSKFEDNAQVTTTTTTTENQSTETNMTNTGSKKDSDGKAIEEDVSQFVRGLKIHCKKELEDRLDLPIPCVHDWRNLAGHYGVPNATIHVWSGKMPHISASHNLFNWLAIVYPDLTIETLKKDLTDFRRRDTIKILQKYYK